MTDSLKNSKILIFVLPQNELWARPQNPFTYRNCEKSSLLHWIVRIQISLAPLREKFPQVFPLKHKRWVGCTGVVMIHMRVWEYNYAHLMKSVYPLKISFIYFPLTSVVVWYHPRCNKAWIKHLKLTKKWSKLILYIGLGCHNPLVFRPLAGRLVEQEFKVK